MDPPLPSESTGTGPVADMLWAAAITAVLILITGAGLGLGSLFYTASILLFSAMAGLILGYWPARTDFGWANRATLLRGCLVVVLISLAPFAERLGDWMWIYGTACLVALILDGVDGAIARRTGSQTAFGARFDMELDAVFILGLCVAVLASGKAGAWVLALGLMRYGFVMASLTLPFLNRPLPESFRRKTVCVWQVVTLMIAVLPIVSTSFASWTLATALILLSYSFLVDLYWLYQRRN